nr:hypothetical protein BaRGS_029338 [Batillaria attramentaria]
MTVKRLRMKSKFLFKCSVFPVIRKFIQGSDAGYEGEEGADLDSLSAAIQFQRQKMEEEVEKYGASSSFLDSQEPRKKRYKKDAYFSDEEEFADD